MESEEDSYQSVQFTLFVAEFWASESIPVAILKNVKKKIHQCTPSIFLLQRLEQKLWASLAQVIQTMR